MLCAGVLGELALDDTYTAGRIADAIGGENSDSATAAIRLARTYANAAEALNGSRSGWNLRRHDLHADIEWCGRENSLDVTRGSPARWARRRKSSRTSRRTRSRRAGAGGTRPAASERPAGRAKEGEAPSGRGRAPREIGLRGLASFPDDSHVYAAGAVRAKSRAVDNIADRCLVSNPPPE